MFVFVKLEKIFRNILQSIRGFLALVFQKIKLFFQLFVPKIKQFSSFVINRIRQTPPCAQDNIYSQTEINDLISEDLLSPFSTEGVDNYWVWHGMFNSHDTLHSNDIKINNRHLWYLRKQIIVHYFKNFFLFPIWLFRFLIPSYLKGENNLWTNLGAIIKKKEFKPLRIAVITQLFFLYAVIQIGVYVFYYHSVPAYAATYNFTQTTWTTASTTATVTHVPGGISTELYSAKDENLAVGDTLTLSLITTSTQETTSTGFGGAFSQAATTSNGIQLGAADRKSVV